MPNKKFRLVKVSFLCFASESITRDSNSRPEIDLNRIYIFANKTIKPQLQLRSPGTQNKWACVSLNWLNCYYILSLDAKEI